MNLILDELEISTDAPTSMGKLIVLPVAAAASPPKAPATPSGLLPTGIPRKESGKEGIPIPLLVSLDEKARARFEKKVDRTGGPNACHPFHGATDGSGYPRFWLRGRNEPAYRVALVIATGKDLPVGPEVDHVCKQRSCVNPRHLRLASHLENMKTVEFLSCGHPPERFEHGWDGRLYCPRCLVTRAHAHDRRERIEPLSPERAVQLLEFFWEQWHRRLDQVPPKPSNADRRALASFIRDLGERQAFLAFRAVLRDWSRFTEFAAHEYGRFYGDPDRAPRRPDLALIARNPAIAANYWRGTDPDEITRRRYGAEVLERRKQEERARRAWAALPPEERERRLLDQEGHGE